VQRVRAICLIALWVALYFNVCRFSWVRMLGARVPLGLKLVIFTVFLFGCLCFANESYKAVLTQKPRRVSPVALSALFLASMAFAIAASDRYLLFMLLSVSIYLFDRLFYYVVYRRAFHRKNLVSP